MPPRIITLRRADECHACHVTLAASTRAWWHPDSRFATCLDCGRAQLGSTPDGPAPSDARDARGARSIPISAPDSGIPGASAQLEYERLRRRRAARIDERWGRLAGIAKLLSNDPSSITVWATGSAGERGLAEGLTARLGDRAVLLHDRKVPKSRANIDHIAIAPSGVWVIDAKKYRGRVERRDKGGLFSVDYRLYVAGRDCTTLVGGLTWQVDAVRDALGGAGVRVHAVICFVDAEWPVFARTFQIRGVSITWGEKLASMIAEPGPLGARDVLRIADQLANALPPKVHAPQGDPPLGTP